MKEEKILKDLFEQARVETPKLSFEQTATRFTNSLSLNLLEFLRTRLLGKKLLNAILVVTVIGSVLVLLDKEETTPTAETTVLIEMESEVKEAEPVTDQLDPLPLVPTTKMTTEKQVLPEVVASTDTLVREELQPDTLELSEAIEEIVDTAITKTDWSQVPAQEQADTLSRTKVESMIMPENRSTTARDSSSKLIVGAEHSNDKQNIKAEEVARTEALSIKKSDNLEDCDKFIEAINKLGLGTKNSSFREVNGKLHKMNLKLSHPKGLAFKLKSRGFEKFELQVHFDEKNKLLGLSYRFNDRAFSRIHSITSKGRVQYNYKEN
jgi:hypothetical protein